MLVHNRRLESNLTEPILYRMPVCSSSIYLSIYCSLALFLFVHTANIGLKQHNAQAQTFSVVRIHSSEQILIAV